MNINLGLNQSDLSKREKGICATLECGVQNARGGLDNKQVLTGSRSLVLQGHGHGVQHVAGLFSVETVINSQKESK